VWLVANCYTPFTFTYNHLDVDAICLDAQGGGYLLQLMDTYSCGWGIFVIALSEAIAIFWVYG